VSAGSQPDAGTKSAGDVSTRASTTVPVPAGGTLRPLSDREIKAGVAALPSGSVIGVATAVLPNLDEERAGSVLRMASGGTVTILLTSGDTAPTASSAPLMASRMKDGLMVVVAADAEAAGHLTQAQLDAVATAVLDAIS
jgi:hypothetical protein